MHRFFLLIFLVALGLVFFSLYSCKSTGRYSKHYLGNASDPNYKAGTDNLVFLSQYLLTQAEFDNLPEEEKASYLEKVRRWFLDKQVNITSEQKAKIEELLEDNLIFYKQGYNDPQSVINSMNSTNGSLLDDNGW